MKVHRVLALGALAVLALPACADSSPESSGTVPTTADPPSTATVAPVSSPAPTTTLPPTTVAPDLATALSGRTFLSTAVEGFALVDGTRIALTFDAQNVGANGGCNMLGSTWTIEADVLVVPPMAQTEMACDPPALMDQDTWLASVLTSRPTLTLDGDALTIAAQGATVTLVDRDVADPDRPLEGAVWTVDTLVTADVAASTAVDARPPTLTFAAGTLSVDTGCNTGTGTYTLADGAVTFGPIATTRMACTAEAAMTEQHVLSVLAGTATVSIEADALTLTNGQRGLVARAG